MITPSPPPVVAYSLDVSFLPDAFATYGANGTLLESGVAQKSNTKHATGIVARVVVGQALFDDIEAKVAALREQFARHDAFDKDALATAAAKRAWKCQQRVIRREMYLNRHMLTAMAKYIGSVPLPTYRAEGDDDDGRVAAYAAYFGGTGLVSPSGPSTDTDEAAVEVIVAEIQGAAA
jgi:hypothetical protein